MDNGPPPLIYSEREDFLPTTTTTTTTKTPKLSDKNHRLRSSSGKGSSLTPSILLAFFSYLALLYIAGRLWQDAENRKLLSHLLMKNFAQRPKVLTVEDKLMVLICKDLERKIVVAEMEITLAKRQGFLKNQLKQPGCSYSKKFLAVIGIYTGFGSRLKEILSEHIGCVEDGHEEADEESSKKAKFFFSTAVQDWDAEFYVKVDDGVHLNLEGIIELLENRRSQDSLYIGCMTSGEVVSEVGKQWYESEWWKFGDEKSYFVHAAGSLIILSKNFAQYISINSASLKTHAHEDTLIDSWMMSI